MPDFEPIKITGIIEEEVSRPRNDGTRGSSLYNVPFQLSRFPPSEWADLFPREWDHPPQFSTMHRPGICRVENNTIWLKGTTLEEVADVHRETLLLVLEETNKKYAAILSKRSAEQEKRRIQQAAHEAHVSEVAKKIKFD